MTVPCTATAAVMVAEALAPPPWAPEAAALAAAEAAAATEEQHRQEDEGAADLLRRRLSFPASWGAATAAWREEGGSAGGSLAEVVPAELQGAAGAAAGGGTEDRGPSGDKANQPPSSPPTTAATPGTAGGGDPPSAGTSRGEPSCELRLEDARLAAEFERLNEQLRRHGFREVPHFLEPATPSEPSYDGGRVGLVADARELWGICGEVLEAYDRRGRRLGDALLAERAEDRHARDARVSSLLQENARLQAELRVRAAAAATPSSGHRAPATPPAAAAPTATAAPTSPPPDGGDTAERRPLPSPSGGGAASTGKLAGDRERDLADALLRARTAEAAARQRERELEKLRTRLEQAVVESTRRQEREREALSKPLRRRTAAPGHSRRDEPLLEAALAYRGKAEALQVDLNAMRKQVHALTFELEGAEERCRRLQAERHMQPRPAGGGHMVEVSPGGPVAADAADLVGRERELRLRAEERLALLREGHAAEVAELATALQRAEERVGRLEAERRSAARQPTSAELRWQREALRLRDELVEARRAWRGLDTQALMRRDKELRRLGLDPRSLEDGLRQGDLSAMVAELCRTLRVRTPADLLPAVCGLQASERAAQDAAREAAARSAEDAATGAEARDRAQRLTEEEQELLDFGHRAMELLQGGPAAARAGDAAGCAPQQPPGRLPMSPQQALAQLQSLSVASQQQHQHRRGGGGVGAEEALLESLADQLRCEVRELPRRAAALLRLCDERVAAQRVVEALQKLLHVGGGVTEVLPALKEVLDVPALRRRAQAFAAARAAAAMAAQEAAEGAAAGFLAPV